MHKKVQDAEFWYPNNPITKEGIGRRYETWEWAYDMVADDADWVTAAPLK